MVVASRIPAAAVLPGDSVVHPVDGHYRQVDAVSRSGDRVTLSFQAAEALRLQRDAAVALR